MFQYDLSYGERPPPVSDHLDFTFSLTGVSTVFDISGYDLTSPFSADVNSSVLTYHRIIEAFKFSYAWRSRLGDPDINSQIDKVSSRNRNRE